MVHQTLFALLWIGACGLAVNAVRLIWRGWTSTAVEGWDSAQDEGIQLFASLAGPLISVLTANMLLPHGGVPTRLMEPGLIVMLAGNAVIYWAVGRSIPIGRIGEALKSRPKKVS